MEAVNFFDLLVNPSLIDTKLDEITAARQIEVLVRLFDDNILKLSSELVSTEDLTNRQRELLNIGSKV